MAVYNKILMLYWIIFYLPTQLLAQRFNEPSLHRLSSNEIPLRGGSRDLKCDMKDCINKIDEDAICCSENFNCLGKSMARNCVYNSTVKIFDNQEISFCRENSKNCFYCCHSGKCQNQNACESFKSDNGENIMMIFIVEICLFFVGLIAISILIALRIIRLNKVLELKSHHKLLTTNTESSAQVSRRETADMKYISEGESGNNDLHESLK